MKAIETIYNGYRFRSRLEARWAVFFDEMGIKYEYEPEGFEMSDGTRYLPDFYLPESDSFFEAKGVMSDIDMHKINQFIEESGKPVTIGYNNFSFVACNNWYTKTFSLDEIGSSWLCRCRNCGKYWFMGNAGSYVCQCCGEYDGDGHLADVFEGDAEFHSRYVGCGNEKRFGKAILKAKQARFEHGEKP